jgi:hypothetical protein
MAHLFIHLYALVVLLALAGSALVVLAWLFNDWRDLCRGKSKPRGDIETP